MGSIRSNEYAFSCLASRLEVLFFLRYVAVASHYLKFVDYSPWTPLDVLTNECTRQVVSADKVLTIAFF